MVRASRHLACIIAAGVIGGLFVDQVADAGVRSMGYGQPGPAGQQGAQGNAGSKGDAGASGSIGPAGPKGDSGPQGQVGPAGAAGSVGPVGPSGPQGVQGVPGVVGATGPQGLQGIQGPAGIISIYGPQGLRANPKMWAGPVMSANGLWTASIASMGCTATPWNVQAQAQGVDSTASGVRVANVSSVSTTTISGTITQAATVSLLGVLSLSLSTASPTQVWVEAHC